MVNDIAPRADLRWRLTVVDLLRRRTLREVMMVLLIFVSGVLIGSRYMAAFQQFGPSEFGQAEFGAAVSLACGHGFSNPEAPSGALSDFLNRRTDTFSCAQFNGNGRLTAPNFTQALYRYLMIAVALQWKWSGISWNALTPLFGALFGLTLCAAYGLFRLAGGPLVALIGVMPLAMSAHHLASLPALRDYAKAPFMLWLMLLMALFARPPYSRRRSVLLAVAFGAVLGVGFGFRNDLLINVPPFIAVVALLLPGGWRENLRVKASCLAVAAVTFVVFAWPILIAYRAGSNTGHVAVLGLTSTFDGSLGVTRPAYDLGPHYLDGFAANVINVHSRVRSGRFVDYLSPEYDKAAIGVITDVVRHWPADIFARGLASTLQVLEFPFTVGQYSPPLPNGLTSPRIRQLYETQAVILRHLMGLGPILAAIAAIVVGSASPLAGIGLMVLTLYYCGYPAVQFHFRHFFHLEFVAWWSLVFVLAATLRGLWRVVARRGTMDDRRRTARAAVVMVVSSVALTVAPLSMLRMYQQHHVAGLVDALLTAHRTPQVVTWTTGSGRALAMVSGLWDGRAPTEPFSVRYLEADFTNENCEAANLPVTITYDARTVANDFSFVARVPIVASGPTKLLIPAYYNGEWSHFIGFAVPDGYDRCLKSVSLVDDLSRVPVLVTFTLTPEWRRKDLFQRLANWEIGPVSQEAIVRVQPMELVAPAEPHIQRVTILRPDNRNASISWKDGRWVGSIPVTVPQQLLLHFPAQLVDAGNVLRAEGVLHRGGLLIGVLENDRFKDSRSVTTRGPFTVLVQAPTAGQFGALVTDYSTMQWRLEPDSMLRRVLSSWGPSLLVDEFELHDLAWIKPGP